MVAGFEQKTTQNPILQSRVLLREGMEQGIEPPDVHEESLLLRGRVHQLYAGPGVGKSWVGLWLTKRCLERGERVLYLDAENGRRIVTERLALLGVDSAEVDDLLWYVSSPSLGLTTEDVGDFAGVLDEVEPSLVVFDSWANFLAGAGLDENSNTDVARWAVAFTHPARNRGITVVILDHVPHEGNHSRGASRKKDEVDVQWKVYNTQPFDRESVGEINLHREKDREAYLPPSVKFSIGGSPEGFVCERSAGTLRLDSGDGLTKTQRKALMVLRTDFRESGVGFNDWQRKVGCSSATLSTAIRVFTNRRLVENREQVYFPLPSLETEEVEHG